MQQLVVVVEEEQKASSAECMQLFQGLACPKHHQQQRVVGRLFKAALPI